MMRPNLALAALLCLSACSGQRNESTKSLNAGRGDAGKDAADDEAADAADTPDADAPDEDASAQNDGGASSGDDAGGGALDAATSDAGADTGSVNSGDSGVSNEAGSGDSSVGDAGTGGDAGTQLRVRLLNYVPIQGPIPANGNLPVVFGNADGTVHSVRELDATGALTSDIAPAMLTVIVPRTNGNGGDTYVNIVTVLGPQLGDELVFGPMQAIGYDDPEPPQRYSVALDNLPANTASLTAYAGVEGCAEGYQDLVDLPISIRQPRGCELDANGSLIVFARDDTDTLLRYAGGPLPPSEAGPVTLALSTWLEPGDFMVTTSNVPSNAQTVVETWMRKQRLRVYTDRPYSPPPNEFTFKVARGLVDSFDVNASFENSTSHDNYYLRKNRAADTTSVALDVQAEALPPLDRSQVTSARQPQLRPSATWGVSGGSTPADALEALFTWSLRQGDFFTSVQWHIVGPASTTSAQVPALPTTGVFALPLIPATDGWFEGVSYYDSDWQDGYRAFLKEPIGSSSQGSDSSFYNVLGRELREGGTLRIVRSHLPAP